ncbi:hypothetical protein D6C76_10542 [Aureobasidium pullulans]|nr:hypothetical protein D6C76_10542 [Aureobasidium pullulans]
MLKDDLKSRGRAPDLTRPSSSREDSSDSQARADIDRIQIPRANGSHWNQYQMGHPPVDQQLLGHTSKYGKDLPIRPASSAASPNRSSTSRNTPGSSPGRSPGLESGRGKQRAPGKPSMDYPDKLTSCCSESLQSLFKTLRRQSSIGSSLVKMKTVITMGVLQKEIEQWHELLRKAGNAQIPGSAADELDPFKTAMILSLLQLCAHLQEAEFHLDGHEPRDASKWQDAHATLEYCSKLGEEIEDQWYSDDESEDEGSPDLGLRSIDTLQPLAKSLARLGFPTASDESSFEASLEDILRSRSSLNCFVPGLELRIYMSSLGKQPSPHVETDRRAKERERTRRVNEEIEKREAKIRGPTCFRA